MIGVAVRIGNAVTYNKELAWTQKVLINVHAFGCRLVADYDPSVIETYLLLGTHLLIVHFRYPDINEEATTAREGLYVNHVIEREGGLGRK